MRTPKEIAEYIDYYKDKPKAEREWAMKNLEEIEGKPIEELKELAADYKNRANAHLKRLTEEQREQIREAIRAGVINKDICEQFEVNHNTVTRIKNAMRDEGEVLPETRGRRPREEQPAEKQPEAYPNQINDETEPIVEDDVKTYIPHECDFAGDCKAGPEKPAEKKSLAECMTDIGAAFCNIFGAGPVKIETEPDTESVDFVSVLIGLMTFAREQFGEDITLDKISCGKQEEKAEIGFYKGGQLYYLGLYSIAEGEEE